MSGLLRLPLIAVQGLCVAARATRLPEAAGPRQGKVGQGDPLRLLILGDSSAAGVGVDDQNNALSGRLIAHLSQDHVIDWQLWARSGLTTARALHLLSHKKAQHFDVAVLALGVNDTKNGVRINRWRHNYKQLIQNLTTRFGVRDIYASGVPPLGALPLLPEPLRSVLGTRAAQFDQALADICMYDKQAHHLRFDIPFDPKLMAQDGFHPSAALYEIWASQIAKAIQSKPAAPTT